MRADAGHLTGLSARIQNDMDHDCVSLQRTQESYKSKFNRRLCRGLEKFETSENVFLDVSDGVIMTLN